MIKGVWLLNNVYHYHRARANAVAKTWPGAFRLLQLTDAAELPVLRAGEQDAADVVTLFPRHAMREIPQGAIRRAIVNYLEKARPDICCLNGWGLPGTAAMLEWAVAHHVPCVVTSDSNKHDQKRYWLKERLKAQFINQCSSALAAGTESRRYLIELGMAPAAIFDGFDVVENDHFHRGAEEARRDPPRFRAQLALPKEYFFACARFERVKNLYRLLEAYTAYVRGAGPSAWNLVIAGDGPTRLELEKCARNLRVEERVIFAGLKTYQELPGMYGLARAFILASTSETWGLVVNEAMAAGLPVLVSEMCGCAPDLVRDGENGFTFDPWDAGEMAQKMLIVHREAALRERMAGRSAEIIAEWGPQRFAVGLQGAVNFALDRGPAKESLVSRAVVRLMSATT